MKVMCIHKHVYTNTMVSITIISSFIMSIIIIIITIIVTISISIRISISVIIISSSSSNMLHSMVITTISITTERIMCVLFYRYVYVH